MIDYIGDHIRKAYSEPHRRWHNINHIYDMLEYCGLDRPSKNEELFYAILWHDFVYIPGAEDNEEKSAEAFLNWIDDNSGYEDLDTERVAFLIRATKEPFKWIRKIQDFDDEFDDDDLYRLISADFAIFGKGREELIAYEKAIFYEFQKYELSQYIKGRTEALQWIQSNYSRAEPEYDACDFLIDYINTKTYKIGVYAGSFNPYHVGHEDIVQQAEKHFDKVVIAQGWNREKEQPPVLEGMHREVVHYSGMLISLFGEHRRVEKTLIRGLRNSFDVGYEDNLRNTLFDFKEIPVVYYFCRKEHEHISSSMIRGLQHFGQDAWERYIPAKGVEIPIPERKKIEHEPIDWEDIFGNITED